MAGLVKETDELLVALTSGQIEHLRSSVHFASVEGVPVFVVTPEGLFLSNAVHMHRKLPTGGVDAQTPSPFADRHGITMTPVSPGST